MRNWSAILNFKGNLEAYDQMLLKEPNNADMWDNRGWILRQLQRYAEALVSHDKALQLKTTNPFTTWFNRGIVLELLQRQAEAKNSYQQAVNSYNKLTSEQQNDPEILYLRGWVFFLLQSNSDAINSLQKAIELDHFYQFLDPISHSEYYGGHLFNWVFPLFANFPQESIYLCQQVAKSLDQHTLRIMPTDHQTLYKIHYCWCKLGEQLAKLNQWQEANIAYDKALAIVPTSAIAIQGKQKIMNQTF
jgi:tetratricopeptide (TPR) repeat protein